MTMTRHERVSGRTPLTTRFRAAVLVVVWSLSGAWSVGHAFAHELEHGYEDQVAEPGEGSVVAMVAAQGHGHSHPEPLLVVATRKAPEIEVPAVLLETAPAVPCSNTLIPWCTRTAPARASPSAAPALGPRAPPLL